MSSDIADKREAIMKTALSLFVERGFHGTPTALISKEAGVATGTLFFYFKTKEDLIDALYKGVKAEAGAAIREDIGRENTVQAKFERVFYNFIRWGTRNPEKMKFMEQFAHSPFVSRSAQEEGISHFLFLDELGREGVMKKEIRNYSSDLVFHMTSGSLSGLIGLIIKTEDEGERGRLIREGLRLLEDGLFNR
jgi:AcrR family transcriptional regulator